MPTTICSHCGVNNRRGANFCNNCGTELRDTDPRDTEPRDTDSRGEDPSIHDDANASTDSAARSAEEFAAQQAQDLKQEAAPIDPQETDAAKHVANVDSQGKESASQVEPDSTAAITEEPRDGSSGETLPTRGVGSGIPGLLQPQTIIGETIEQVSRPQAAAKLVDDADLRRIHTLMTSEPMPQVQSDKSDQSAPPSIRIPWIFALLALALAIPIFLEFSGPAGAANELPGVAAAFNTVDRLDKPIVLLLWEYAPATAGELDQVIEPVLLHLEDKGYQAVLASTLPTGPATARRMLREVHNVQGRNGLLTSLDLGYLPGGAAILPLLAQERGAILPSNQRTPSALLNSQLDLVVVASARAEEVQQWLEQGQTINQATTIAVTSAAADPYLRPFLDSGQLSGIVSGFDGGIAYQQLYNRSGSANGEASTNAIDAVPSVQQFRQQVYQNWGHLTIFLLILLGNFSMLSNRSPETKQSKNRQAAEQSNV